MLALLVPGVGMGGSSAPEEPKGSGSSLGSRGRRTARSYRNRRIRK